MLIAYVLVGSVLVPLPVSRWMLCKRSSRSTYKNRREIGSRLQDVRVINLRLWSLSCAELARAQYAASRRFDGPLGGVSGAAAK